VAGQKLEIEQGDGIGDDTGGGVGVGLKGILRAATEEQFVGEDPQAQIKDGLAGYEFFVHEGTPCIVHRHGAAGKNKPARGGRWLRAAPGKCVRTFPQGLKPNHTQALIVGAKAPTPVKAAASRRTPKGVRDANRRLAFPEGITLGGHGVEELHVGFGFAEAAEQKLHGLNGGKRAENLAQDPNAAQLVGREKEFVLTRAGALNVDGWEHALIGEAAIEIDFHVAGALEFLKDDVVHAAAGVDQSGGDDGERAAFFDVAGRGKEAARALQGVGINTAAEDFTGRRCDGVIGAGEAGNGVQEDNDIALVLDETLGFFREPFRRPECGAGRLIEGELMTSPLHGALHVRDFFRTLVDEEHDQSHVRMIDVTELAMDCSIMVLPVRGGRIDQPALTLADGQRRFENAAGEVLLGGFHFEAALG